MSRVTIPCRGRAITLTPLAAPPESISIQRVGGLAIRPGGLLTVTEDVGSQVKQPDSLTHRLTALRSRSSA
jgi:hypothetical protein